MEILINILEIIILVGAAITTTAFAIMILYLLREVMKDGNDDVD